MSSNHCERSTARCSLHPTSKRPSCTCARSLARLRLSSFFVSSATRNKQHSIWATCFFCTTRSITLETCPPHNIGAPPTSHSYPLRYACFSFNPRQAARSPTSEQRFPLLCPRLALTSRSRPARKFSGSALSTSPHQASPAPFVHHSRLTDAANAVAVSRKRSKQAALMLFSDSPAALDSSLQPLNAYTAAVKPVVNTRRRSGPAAARSPAPHSPPHVEPVTVAAAVPQPSARAAPAVAPPQPSKQARLHAPPPFLDSSFAIECAVGFILPAGAAESSTPAPGPATHPIALSREEYHAWYEATYPTRGEKFGKTPTPATSQAQQPESAGAASTKSEEPRPTTPSLPALTASQSSVVSASLSTTIAPAQKSPKPRKSRRVSAVQKTRAHRLCLSRSNRLQAKKLRRTRPLAQLQRRLQPHPFALSRWALSRWLLRWSRRVPPRTHICTSSRGRLRANRQSRRAAHCKSRSHKREVTAR